MPSTARWHLHGRIDHHCHLYANNCRWHNGGGSTLDVIVNLAHAKAGYQVTMAVGCAFGSLTFSTFNFRCSIGLPASPYTELESELPKVHRRLDALERRLCLRTDAVGLDEMVNFPEIKRRLVARSHPGMAGPYGAVTSKPLPVLRRPRPNQHRNRTADTISWQTTGGAHPKKPREHARQITISRHIPAMLQAGSQTIDV